MKEKLCCLVKTKVACDACGQKWCAKCWSKENLWAGVKNKSPHLAYYEFILCHEGTHNETLYPVNRSGVVRLVKEMRPEDKGAGHYYEWRDDQGEEFSL